MHVVVTGATGFVGAPVVRELLRRGHRVTGLVRSAEKAQPLIEAGMTAAIGDMWRPETYRELPAAADAVIHAAQDKVTGRWTRRAVARMHESDLLMTRTLAEGCLKHGRTFIYTSGGLKYADSRNEWITEDAPTRPCLLAKGHADAVAELFALHRERGLKVMVVTPGFVYGPGGILASMVDQLRKGEYRVMGDGSNYWSLVDVDDLAVLYALALERGRAGGHWFAADDRPMRRRALVDLLARALKLPRPGWIPGWLLGLYLGFPLAEAIRSPMRMRNDRAKQELGWSPRHPSFADGLPSALRGLGIEADPAAFAEESARGG